MKQVLIVAAEASSALFAQRLLQYWKKNNTSVSAFGVGSQAMEELGFERFGKAEEMAVVGAAEIIEHYAELKKVFNNLVEQAEIRKPAVAIVMDYPDFNLMLAKKLKALGIPVIYYISPQVWAWRKGRVKKIKKFCEKILVLFPFEVPFYQKENVPVEFVGHPLLDELDEKYFSEKHRKQQRNRCGIQDNDIVIGLMPGSRRLEISQHLQLQFKVAEKLYKSYPNIKILLMCAPSVDRDALREKLDDIRLPYILQKDDPAQMIQLCDVILAASGTATLLVGLLEKPMVIMYKMKWLTGIIAKVLVRGVRFFGIVNLISEREIVPERWQGGANPDELFNLMKRYLDDSDYKNKVVQDLKLLKSKLGERGATEKVASVVNTYLEK
jgi:lipid-A-disaccharide synthase